MILYTMMPQELIFPTREEEYGKHTLLKYKGIPLLAEAGADNSYTVVRILSTDPQHFLDPDCTPGTKISFSAFMQ